MRHVIYTQRKLCYYKCLKNIVKIAFGFFGGLLPLLDSRQESTESQWGRMLSKGFEPRPLHLSFPVYGLLVTPRAKVAPDLILFLTL